MYGSGQQSDASGIDIRFHANGNPAVSGRNGVYARAKCPLVGGQPGARR
jgi:hypothetical protein